MSMDYATVEMVRQRHPAWRMLRSDHAPPIASFLHRVFIAPNIRVMAQTDLEEALEDELFGLRERMGADAFPKAALDYLNVSRVAAPMRYPPLGRHRYPRFCHP